MDELSYAEQRLWIFFKTIWRHGTPAVFEATLCTECGMIFTNPRLTADEIRVKYETVGELESAGRDTEVPFRSNRTERARRIHSLLVGLRPGGHGAGDVLDYGGAQGDNLIPFVEAGDSCYLLDYVRHNLPEGVAYLGADERDLSADRVFDVVLLCHTLEHVIDPQGMVTSLASHLSDAGLLYVEVPLGCWREWKRLDEPLTHVNFFSEESLFNCVRSAGLDVVHLSTAYQWVAGGKAWCVNIVGGKGGDGAVAEFMTTRQQMGNPYYYLGALKSDPGYCLRRLVKRLSRKFGKA